MPPGVLNATRFYRRVTNAAGGLTSDSCSEISSMTRIRVIDLDPGALDPIQNQTYCYGAMPPSLISSMTGGGIQMDAIMMEQLLINGKCLLTMQIGPILLLQPITSIIHLRYFKRLGIEE